MSDRKPPQDLFDFPTGQVDAAVDRNVQQGLFEDEPRGQGVEFGPALEAPVRPEEEYLGDDALGLMVEEDESTAEAAHVAQGQGGRDDGMGGVGARWLAGVADVLFHATALCLVVIAMLQLGLPASLQLWPGFAVFLASFSFLYVTLPLAFWGKTPGMAWQGLKTLDQNGMALTYSQTVLRWVGGVMTVALLGLPVLLAFSGRSLADRMSNTWTVPAA